MSRFGILLVALLILPSLAWATEPPAYAPYAAGWGMNPNDWSVASGSWSSGLGLYDPDGPYGGGGNWVVGWNPSVYIDYAPITLELWIEMNAIQTYNYTSYQWHRTTAWANENVSFTIDGTVQSNENLWVSLWAASGYEDGNLKAIESVGGIADQDQTDLEIDWRSRWGEGLTVGSSITEDWTSVTWGSEEVGSLFLNVANPDLEGQIPLCDHWFQFEGTFELARHTPDGYYKLELEGCPSPTL